MPEIENTSNLVSVIIPCYNGAALIQETLNSILMQTDAEFEIIFIDDGSTDTTKAKVEEYNDSRIRYFYQKNQGVSAARNFGLTHASGEFVVFFDADDKMDNDFLSSRIGFLRQNPPVDFVCGEVQKFNDEGFIEGYFRGTSSDAVNEILLYDAEVTTCPSNYMFRSSFLKKHRLMFNTALSSTADKYFLIQCSIFGRCEHKKEVGRLYYRILENSMSHHLTEKLIRDNEQYYVQLNKHALIPEDIKKRALFMGYFILFSSFWKVSLYKNATFFAFKAFFTSPKAFLAKCLQ